eukprot:CAMPEP_0118708968 /NCGR_PEP_ID=MMETSP0800-20121206/22283_1 /TAXON_ID=210618 ORGANISM="Striatella unipunctata, Strain CCMP2910" /NCGR_SAMPLE_ID=MMETSP0800 /ASSEMBLY_ACC=CAM_ASM_000638 /LENGTH=35 /DNA_ID= /DNA_START= /DNA_END= /DNA_ORIENTATION=
MTLPATAAAPMRRREDFFAGPEGPDLALVACETPP